MPRSPLHLALACAALAALAPAPARADDAGTSQAETVTPGNSNPERYLTINGVVTDVTNNPRAQNLNPEGVNYQDCAENLRMDFSIVLTGFDAEDEASLQVWAGTEDCTQDVNRSITGGALHPCWQVYPLSNAITATSSQTRTISVYARDVLRYSQPPTSTDLSQPYDPDFSSSKAGPSACLVQPTDAAVPVSIFFIPVQPPAHAIGVAYEYSLSTDLVAPPPPSQAPLQSGDTLLTVDWSSPGNDPDIAGFEVYSDPPAGTTSSGGCGCGNAAGSSPSTVVVDGSMEDGMQCMAAQASIVKTDIPFDVDADALETSTPESGPGEASTDAAPASTDGAVEAEEGGLDAGAPKADAGGATDGGGGRPVTCSPPPSGGCSDPALTNQQFLVGSANTDAGTTAPGDDGGDGGDDGGVVGVTLGGGGISTINSAYEASEIDTLSTTSLTLSGLTNGANYHVVIVSFDASGNYGPASNLRCAKPGAVNDFWQSYKDDGGTANGCALERNSDAQTGSVFGLGIFAAAAALIRRRRR